MKNIRAVLRLTTFSIVAFSAVLLGMLGRVIISSKRHSTRWKNKVARWFARTSSAIIGLNITIEGTPPEPPFFLVTNHLSYVDILPLWASTKGTFIAKREVESWPFFGLACKVFGVIFIDRKNNRDIPRVNKLISDKLTKEQGVILFPEGTSSAGREVLPFRAPLLYYPARTHTPVSSATILYETGDEKYPASEFVCWWGDMTFFNHFYNLLKIKSINVTIRFSSKTITENNRKTLADSLYSHISEQFNKVRMEREET